ncbi:rRNA maturation RNase YbeY [Salinisphaera sp. P385]|uniref:Endoribonuclease YbeY n=1 Tax=Spectribacter acetivorans TaxID=3075603 RepID=A0ABU3B669_9GAMM|nr:rRNA maturation RNase YbeY [Salinisphaera sp. P385]MDT0617625.1 rRNA maturation RNase YbeY [Salinisphaera sp. P385]
MTLVVDIQRESAEPAPDDEDLSRAVAAALAGRRDQAELCLRLVDEAESAALNHRYRGRSGPTNVLSFPCDAGLPDCHLLGDLVICAPLVAREARAQDKAVADHWAHLTIHGVLHLLGYDHVEDADADIMENEERAVLAGLGIADPYALPADTDTMSQ